MKLQLHGQRLRLRITEAELADLVSGIPLSLQMRYGEQTVFEFGLRVADALSVDFGSRWKIALPSAVLSAYVASLPRRDALVLPLAGEPAGLTLEFEVDVRDSIAVRGHGKGSRRPPPG